MPTVADIIKIIEKMAPRRLAEEWDNVGLHFGDPDWPVSTVFVSLDPSLAALEAAASAGAEMLVTHHPLIFRPVKHIRLNTPFGKTIDFAARNRMAVYCAHTNLDATDGGVNDALAEAIGLKVSGPLAPAPEADRFKLVVFVPPADAEKIFAAVWEVCSGQIGKYRQCAFHNTGTGRFVPGEGSRPHTGTAGTPVRTEEIRIEIPVQKGDIDAVISRIKAVHPYETVAYDVYPLFGDQSDNGIGRIGEFSETRTLEQVAAAVRQTLGLAVVKVAGPVGLEIKKAAVCSGSGASMAGAFLSSGAQLYISGDMNHHAALDIAAAGLGLIDIGHFASERVIVPVLGDRIAQAAQRMGIPVRVIPWRDEPDPFRPVF